MHGIVFQAIWDDGQKTRMSVFCESDPQSLGPLHDHGALLNLGRAVRVSWAAYQSRTKGQGRSYLIKQGQFERNGLVLEKCEDINICDHGAAVFAP
jgi:hypothetical protein